MTSHITFIYRIRMALLIVFLISGAGWGAERDIAVPEGSISPASSESLDETIQPEEQGPLPVRPETHRYVNVHSGYRFFSQNRFGGRAAEYEYLHSNPDLAAQFTYLGTDTKFSVDGVYLNDKDYHGEMVYDYKGIYRFDLRTESFFHNLDHDLLFSPGFDLFGSLYQPNPDPDPGARYGIRVEQDQARFRYKLIRLPVHINFGYWRMVKEGTSQLRFSDHAFEGTPNTFYALTRGMDRQTHEGRFGLDSHLGLFDLTYDFRIREFREQTATPADIIYSARPALLQPAGAFQHNENPDSRFYSHKIGLHTSMAGGLVGAVSYVYGKRENLSNLTDVAGARQVNDTIHTLAGDFSYTPCTYFSLAVKYRRSEIDRDTPATVLYAPRSVPVVAVRPAIDTRKDTVTATAIYRPVTLLTVKGEYKGEYLSRDNLVSWVMPGRIATQTYPDNSTTHTGSLTLLSRPVKGVRAKLQYLYTSSDNPAYANLPEEKHEGSFLLGYTASSIWGVTANTRISRASSDHASITTIVPDPAIPVTPANSATYPMPKNMKAAHATLSVWLVPLSRLTLSGSYGLIRSSSDQEILFAGVQAGSVTASNYTQQAQVYAVNGVYHHDERLDLSLGLQQVRSTADFDPRHLSLGPTSDTSGVREISQLATVESSLAARADYHLTRNVTCTLEYAFKDYDDKYQTQFNGNVNSVAVYLAAKW